MPPVIALTLTLLFIGFLFRRDYKQGYTPSLALSIPCVWMLILGSRSVTEWLYLGSPVSGGGDATEGSPLDRTVYFLLMGASLVVLLKRGISWTHLLRQNIALVIFFLYCGMSIVWSDFPFVTFKRWFKGFGDPLVILIILTDRNPLRAAEVVFRVCTNTLVPLSILFIKYYPHLGRTYSEWTGAATYTGVTTNKNMLGFMLMVCGLSLVWRLYSRWGVQDGGKLDNRVIPLVLLCMVGWLFSMADSKTSLMGFILGVVIFFILGRKGLRRNLGSYLVVGVVLFVVLQGAFNITELLITSAGRDATLTGRTELWEVVLQMQHHPILGFGFDTFWLGDRLKTLQDRWYFRPTQAHNGYIELYLNLGVVGLLVFSGVVFSCYTKAREILLSSQERTEQINWGRLGMAFLFVYLMYNYTEAAFKTPHFLFAVFLLFGMHYVQPRQMAGRMSRSSLPNESRNVSGVTGAGIVSHARSTLRAS